MLNLELKSIIMQTRKGSPIENSQCSAISSFEKNYLAEIERQYADKYDCRGELSGIFNCHGMVFASRRTGIHKASEVWKILQEDDYIEIPREKVLPGDILLYFDSRGDIEHSAIVIEKPLPEYFHIPKVVSKWGKASEVLHHANACPYSFENPKYYRIMR